MTKRFNIFQKNNKQDWNPDLFLTLGTTEYHPVDDTVLEDALGLEKTTNQAGQQISEMADMFINEMVSDILNGLDTDNEFKACVDAFKGVNVLTGLDIKLEKFEYNELENVIDAFCN